METEVEPTSAREKTRYFNRMDKAFGILCLCISPELLFHVESCSTPNEVWKILEELFGKQDEMLRMIKDSIAIYRNRCESFCLEPEDPHVASLYTTNYVQGVQETDGGDPNQLEGTIRGTVYAPGCANVACTRNEPKKDNVAAIQATATLLQPTKLSVTRSSSRLSSSSSHVSRAFGFEAATSTRVSFSLQDDVKEFAEKCADATKRLSGRRFSDPPVQADMKLWPFKVVSRPDNKPMIEVDNKRDSSDQRPLRGRPPGTSIPKQQQPMGEPQDFTTQISVRREGTSCAANTMDNNWKQCLVEKLTKLNSTRDNVEVTSRWCMFYRNRAHAIVETWGREF